MAENDWKSRLKQNLSASRKANAKSRYGQQGLTSQAAKINSHGFRKLFSSRGIDKQGTNQSLNSFKRNAQHPMMARHVPKGEKFVLTHSSNPNNPPSGNYLAKTSAGRSPEKRTRRLALPHYNTADREKTVKTARSQNMVYGKTGRQPGFQKADPKHISRPGGHMQTISDGGYRGGAIKDLQKISRGKTLHNRMSGISKSSGVGRSAGSNISRSTGGNSQGRSQSR